MFPTATPDPSTDLVIGAQAQLTADEQAVIEDQAMLALHLQGCQQQGNTSLNCLAAAQDQERLDVDKSAVTRDEALIVSAETPPPS
jgi:hypothetical protein